MLGHLLLALMVLVQPQEPPRPITLFAAVSLKEVVTEIAAEWTRMTGTPVRLQFDSSSTLARQIREGAKADLFISADGEWLAVAGAGDRFDWVGNRLLAVAPRNSPLQKLGEARSLVLGGASVPVGRYARAAMANLGIPLPKRIINGANARDVLSKVTQGAGDAGVVYATDVSGNTEIKILYVFPPASHPPVTYPAGLMTPHGKPLFQELQKAWVKAIAAGRGFIVP